MLAQNNDSSPFSILLSHTPSSAIQIIDRVLVYNPTQRLSGQDFLTHPFFEEIFSQSLNRTNSMPINCLTRQDLEDVIEGRS